MRTTRIIYDREWNEYRVKLYVNGKHVKDADYHTDDKEDAILTAKHMEKQNAR